MNPRETIAIARALVRGVIDGDAHTVTQTELRRAVSCAYYAMFHTLAASNADVLVGASPSDRQRWAWRQAYRAVDHRPTRNKLSRASLGGRFPVAIRNFGEVFATAQQLRHSADYDPRSEFSPTDVENVIEKVAANIAAFNITPVTVRRDLAIHILTNIRSD